MEILLHHHVAPTRELGVLVTHDYRIDGCLTRGIFRSVDKADEIAVVEVAESMYFVGHGNGKADARHDLRSKLEAQIEPLCTDVKQQVARRSDGMPIAHMDLVEGMQLRWPRRAKEPVPCFGSERQDTRQSRLDVTKSHRTQERGQVSTE